MTTPPSSAEATTAVPGPRGGTRRRTPRAARPGGLRSNPWATLVAVAVGLFMVGLDGSVVAIANPFIGRDLGASLSQLQWITNSYLLALAGTLILGGKLGDRYGRRKFFLVGLVGFTLSSAAIGLSGSATGVIAFRAVQGLSGALMMPNTLGLLRAVFPPRTFGMAVGIWAAVNSVATAAGPLVGGFLVEHVNWESVFFLNVPVGIVGLVLGLLVLPESRNGEEGTRFDVPGVVLLALAMVAIVYPIVQSEHHGWGSPGTLGVLVAGIALLVAFVVVEKRTASPLLPMRLFRNPSLSVATVVTAANFFVMLGVIFALMLYLQNVRGYGPVQAGLLTLPLSLASMVASPLGAALTGRFGPRVTMPAGMLLQAGASFGMLGFSTSSSYLGMWPCFVAIGLGVGMVMSASSEAIVGNAPVEDAGVAGGLQSTALQVGGALGTSVLLSVLGSTVAGAWTGRLGDAGVPADTTAALAGASEPVAQGVAPATTGLPDAVAAAVQQATGATFVDGFHAVVVVTGVVCLVAALLAAVLVRRGENAVDAPVVH